MCNSPVVLVDPSGMGSKDGAYIVERCPGEQSNEWGCLARFPRGWLFPQTFTLDGHTYVSEHTVKATRIQCDCRHTFAFRRSCQMTLSHRHIITKEPLCKDWLPVIVKDKTTFIDRMPPVTECVRVVPRSCPPPVLHGPYPKTAAGDALRECHRALRETWRETKQCGEDIAEAEPFRSACLVICSMYPNKADMHCVEKWCDRGVCPPISPIHPLEPQDIVRGAKKGWLKHSIRK